jgi:hypothetical protein
VPDIVISEFMDEKTVFEALAGLDLHYDPGLVDGCDARGIRLLFS